MAKDSLAPATQRIPVVPGVAFDAEKISALSQLELNRLSLQVALQGSRQDLGSLLNYGSIPDDENGDSAESQFGRDDDSTESTSSLLTLDPYFQDPEVDDMYRTKGVRPLMGLLHYAALSPIDSQPLGKIEDLLGFGCSWNAVDADGNTAADIVQAKLALCTEDEREVYGPIYKLLLSTGIRTEFFIHRLSQLQTDEASNVVDDGVLDISDVDRLAVSNAAYLQSRLKVSIDPISGETRILTADGDAVMMGWENDVMDDAFCVLNIGFGLGLVDRGLQSEIVAAPLSRPVKHVIVEPHPDILSFMRDQEWLQSRSEKVDVQIFEGRWQDFITSNTDRFDAIYFDTFSEHWSDLSEYFSCLPRLLKDKSSSSALNPSSSVTPDFATSQGRVCSRAQEIRGPRFSFFNGLGGTNLIFYDVYTAIAQMELEQLGFQVTWEEVKIDDHALNSQSADGVKRKYWDLPVLRIPIVYYK